MWPFLKSYGESVGPTTMPKPSWVKVFPPYASKWNTSGAPGLPSVLELWHYMGNVIEFASATRRSSASAAPAVVGAASPDATQQSVICHWAELSCFGSQSQKWTFGSTPVGQSCLAAWLPSLWCHNWEFLLYNSWSCTASPWLGSCTPSRQQPSSK